MKRISRFLVFAAAALALFSCGRVDAGRASAPLIDNFFNCPKVVLKGNNSFIETFAGDKKLVFEISPFPPQSHDSAQVFNFGKVRADGRVIKESSDDIAAYRVFGTTIGANHGYKKTDCSVAGHGKGFADVGSVYTDGSAQWVICEVPDADTITVTARASNTGFTGGTLTHLSGGANTGSFTPSSVVQGQLYPAIKNRRLSIAIDGAALPDQSGTFPFQESVAFSESYEIMNKNSITEWLITRAGTDTEILNYEGTADISVSMEYRFDASGGCTIYTDFQALNDIAAFTDIMFVMAYTFTPDVDGPVRYYVPKSLPFTHENVEYNLSELRDMTGFGITNRIDLTADRCEPGGQLCDRLLMMNDSLGLAVGFLPILDAAPGVRRTNASRKALQLSQLMKVYMSCIDGAKSSLTAGDYFSAVAYRNYFPRSDERTASYVVKTREGDYLYCDWHKAGTDRVPLPQNLQGRPYELVEKSANVTILAASAPDFAEFEITPEKSYGYAILYFPHIR